MFKKIIILSFFILSTNLFAQDYNEQFLEICKQGKIRESKDFLDNWEKSEPNNPEMFVALFNYYLIESKAKFSGPKIFGGTIIATENDSTSVGDVLKSVHESDSLFSISQKYLSKGISINKDRLDMYIGRATTLMEKNVNAEFITSVKDIITRNSVNKGKWLWTNNEPIQKTEDEFVNMIQSYINAIFQAPNADINEILNLSELALKTYPSNYILLSNIGVCMLELGKYKEAIPFFEKGLQSNPKDMILRFNLADAYVQLKQISKAKEYYNFIIKNGNEQYSNYAKEILEKLD
ncbi:tetratricopeptide repeat protein [Kordia sp.]|uniref:tetratricopeptide repeat protein n=1 Tax=Kordia sp. TaxID=1965332 RepID=UPI003B5A4A58